MLFVLHISTYLSTVLLMRGNVELVGWLAGYQVLELVCVLGELKTIEVNRWERVESTTR